MQISNKESIRRFTIGEMPLIQSTIKRLGFDRILSQKLNTHGNQKVDTTSLILILVHNIACGRTPFYELKQWIEKIDNRIFGLEKPYEISLLNDDIFGRALDKLFKIDRASLMTEIALSTVRTVNLDLSRIHNDSTTVKAFGKYPGKTSSGLQLAQGVSKDHRPDLKQLLFTLTVSSDGAVPVHYKTYPGNRTDDTTHIDTWNSLCTIAGKTNFLYVADSKVCTDKQLSYIVKRGGRVVTIMPETWKECNHFKSELKEHVKHKKRIWRREIPGRDDEYETFSTFAGETYTEKRGYRIHWIYSSEKKKRDRRSREEKMKKVENELGELSSKINRRKLKTFDAIQDAVNTILEKYNMQSFYHTKLIQRKEFSRKQDNRGRPGVSTKYITIEKTVYAIGWARNETSLKQEKRVDGIFPILSTDNQLSSLEALKAYKYQPRLEKRFTQFKDIHNAAPLLFKKLERIEAVMFVFFLALIVQSVIEREIRKEMEKENIDWLPIYPEGRISYHPTTAKIFDRFEGVSEYYRSEKGNIVAKYRDDLTELQKLILKMLKIRECEYWPESD